MSNNVGDTPMKLTTVAFVGIAAIIICGGAADISEAPPTVDGTAYCAAISGLFANGGAEMADATRSSCMKTETEYAKKLTRVWTSVPDTDRKTCVGVMMLSQQSNQSLAGCISLAMAKHFLDGDLKICPD
jgi:hypothetical protein